MKALILSAGSERGNPIFNDYMRAIQRQLPDALGLQYRDEYMALGAARFEKKVRDLARANEVTHVFVILAGWDFLLDLTFLDELARDRTLLLFTFDGEYFFENCDRYYGQVADLVVVPDTLVRHEFEQLNIPCHTSFALYDTRDSYRPLGIPTDVDVSFIGNLDIGRRREYIGALRDHGIQVEVYGAGSEHGPLSKEEMVRLFNRSRINLNFTGMADFSKSPPGLPHIRQRIRQAKGRPIEASLCGGFLLSEDAPGLHEMFSVGSEIDTFGGIEELVRKVRYYLANEPVRAAMARKAHERALSQYDIDTGFAEIVRLARGARRRDPMVYLDSGFRADFAIYHMGVAARHLARLRLRHFAEEIPKIMRARSFGPGRLFAEFRWILQRVIHRWTTSAR